MLDYMELIDQAARVAGEAVGEAETAVILGSGLGDYADELAGSRAIAYRDIAGFPASTVQGHAGRLVSGELNGKRVLMMQGRFHAYEGYTMEEVTLPVRVMARMGIQNLIVTNAAGGVNLDFAPGDLMLITDFINFSGMNPLTGKNLDAFGPRFPDMTRAFDRDLMALARREAERLFIPLKEGVYLWMNGPCYETPAEIRMARVLGADAVGMSTVPEVIAARHGGMRVLGVSCVTNMAAGILDRPLDHQEVVETSSRVKDTFRRLLNGVIEHM